jgi:hypothetical protein
MVSIIGVKANTLVQIEVTKICLYDDHDGPGDDTDEIYIRIVYTDINSKNRDENNRDNYVKVKEKTCVDNPYSLSTNYKVKDGTKLTLYLRDRDWTNPDDPIGGGWTYEISSSKGSYLNENQLGDEVEIWFNVNI